MGQRYKFWQPRSEVIPRDLEQLVQVIYKNRAFTSISGLDYGDWGLASAYELILDAIKSKKRIALYADYDVDGTMSCVSWIWFFKAIGHDNFTYYIPDRFKEGYGVNLAAVQYLALEQKAELIITMDTGITANTEALWCKENGIDFICTDHHKIQIDKMPDCKILNPKLHPDPSYQELCGCGVTFVLLRKLGKDFAVPAAVWTDILGLVGMATICDVVPLNPVNHRLAQLGVNALLRSERPVLQKMLQACAIDLDSLDESDVGFKLGPRINAVGRLEHALLVVEAFIQDNPSELIKKMGSCNEQRKRIQNEIVKEARQQAKQYPDDPILLLGGDWHEGVIGIAAAKIAEEFWRPTLLFNNCKSLYKGSARSIPGFDVTDAISSIGNLFAKFGGHAAAAGFTFHPENLAFIREGLLRFAWQKFEEAPCMWDSTFNYDCAIEADLLNLHLVDKLDLIRPFGHKFEQPVFLMEGVVKKVQYYLDKLTREPKHTAIFLDYGPRNEIKVMFFNEVCELAVSKSAQFLVSINKNFFRGQRSLSLIGFDYKCG